MEAIILFKGSLKSLQARGLEILNLLASDASEQIVGQTASAETERLVVEPVCTQDLLN